MQTHNHKIVKTLLNSWRNYGQILEENEYCQSLPRAVAKLREKLDKSDKNISRVFIGVLNFGGKKYNWFERMDGKVKYFRLEEVAERNNFAEQNVVNRQCGLFDKRSWEVAS